VSLLPKLLTAVLDEKTISAGDRDKPLRAEQSIQTTRLDKLPVKAETSQLLSKKTGDVVTVRLTARNRR